MKNLKNALIALLLVLASCTKTTQKPEEFAVSTQGKVIATELYRLDGINSSGKPDTFYVKRTVESLVYNISVSDKAGAVGVSYTQNNATGTITNLSTSNSKWSQCMKNAIMTCAYYGDLCPCKNEWYIGCFIGWSGYCLFNKTHVTKL